MNELDEDFRPSNSVISPATQIGTKRRSVEVCLGSGSERNGAVINQAREDNSSRNVEDILAAIQEAKRARDIGEGNVQDTSYVGRFQF